MWSVWSDSVDLYLAQGLAMFKVPGQDVVVVRSPMTLPLERVLANLWGSLQTASTAGVPKRAKLRVVLSGAMCPAVGVSIPPAVTQWEEVRQLVAATAAQVMGIGVEHLVWTSDPLRTGVAAATTTALWAELHRWAEQHQLRITSLQPTWGVAMQCAAARTRQVRALLVQESDAVTLLADGVGGHNASTTLVGPADTAGFESSVRRWLVGADVSTEELLRLSFDVPPREILARGPDIWTGHWGIV